MRRTTMRVAALLAVLLGGFVVDSAAQGVQTGSIRGTVTDQQNLPVPGVTVTLQSPAIQGVRTTVTAGDGSYSFLLLPPGRYQLTYEIASFTPVKRSTDILLGLSVEQNVTLTAAGRTEEVQVVAAAPAPIVNPTVGANYKYEEINALATQRTLSGVAQLAPGLNENSPNAGQVSINGAFAFDNVFMLNGVDVNDNLFGSPQNLFIEDAIEETQVLTSGISAEYGRFTGGVVNAVTKSGGNNFSGTFRTNLQNPNWTDETPFEDRNNIKRPDDMQQTYEATVGGPVMRDRLWFFAAGRLAETSTNGTRPETNIPFNTVENNKRGEFKLTGTVKSSHTFQGGYTNNATEQTGRPSFGFSIDRFTFGDRSLPNWYGFGSYRGVLRSNLLVEAQYTQRKFGFESSGGSATNLVDSPFIDVNLGEWHYNAEYFDDSDPENRNNRQFTGNVTYFMNTANAGRHEFKAGYEFFRSQRTGGNSQSPTSYVFRADYLTDASGAPVIQPDGHLIPVFVPGESRLENWLPVRGAVLNVDTNSIFVQDHWAVSNKLSADVGIRLEVAKSEATGGILGVDATAFMPRLAASYDINGNGNQIFHVTYGWYSGRYNEAQIGGNNNVGNPDATVAIYQGPAGQGRSFAPGFNPANYEIAAGAFPTANVFMADGLRAPLVKEFTASFGNTFVQGRAFAEASYIHRDTSNIIDDFISIANGTTTVVKNGIDYGTFTNIIWDNADDAFRKYDGLLFQGRYSLMNNWTVNGHYTVQLRNEGNYNGENTNQPGLPTLIGDYPEIFTAARHFPEGRLPFSFQQHKLRLWTIYNAQMGRLGDASFSALMRVDSKGVFSLAAAGQPLTSIQEARLAAAGYPDAPSSQTVYFDERGSEMYPHYAVVDIGLGYNVPVFRTLRPWIRLDVYNAFNNQKLVAWNTTVRQDPNSPVDSLGLRTGFLRGASFGTGTSNAHYPNPFTGLTGGRTLRLAFGVRF